MGTEALLHPQRLSSIPKANPELQTEEKYAMKSKMLMNDDDLFGS